ncbi:tyrosine-type recombinase/integrase [Trinickia mobilis]|uniref:tyrosine-type recombinase/integrase n=1 Tax=Trinickia mobilis TaxID=2816356 RepID=UPI0035ABAB59
MPDTQLATVQPVESLVVPDVLDGRDGINRGSIEHSQLSARNDLDAVRAWLSNFADTKTTFDNYRKEAERLLLWAVVQLGKPLSSLTHEDLLLFKGFLVDPQPVGRWVSANGGKYPRGDARWRPFNGPLSPASQRQALIILNAMFTWLVNAGYLRGNPMALLRQRAKRSAPRVTRYLSVSLWDEVKEFVQQLPQETEAQRAYYARCRWLTTLFYLQGMRISEVAGGQMGNFFRRLGADGQDQWWLETLGKGDKERIVPASPELIQELRRYRTANGLSALPTRAEETPLILPFKGKARCLSRSAIHDAIKGVFGSAAAWLRNKGPEFADRADELERASAHWLRHTAGSHQADGGVDLRTIRDNLGHVSLNTTSLYLHTEDDERHRETVARHRMNWNDAKNPSGS